MASAPALSAGRARRTSTPLKRPLTAAQWCQDFHLRGMIMHPAAEDVRQARADARADLVRRLFAVAISIGFGATLAPMNWVQNGRLPGPDEFDQTLALLTALLATVLSWDGHLLSMRSTPLFDFWRFLINIALAFIYMFLLMASVHPGCVLWTLAIIFFCMWSGTCSRSGRTSQATITRAPAWLSPRRGRSGTSMRAALPANRKFSRDL